MGADPDLFDRWQYLPEHLQAAKDRINALDTLARLGNRTTHQHRPARPRRRQPRTTSTHQRHPPTGHDRQHPTHQTTPDRHRTPKEPKSNSDRYEIVEDGKVRPHSQCIRPGCGAIRGRWRNTHTRDPEVLAAERRHRAKIRGEAQRRCGHPRTTPRRASTGQTAHHNHIASNRSGGGDIVRCRRQRRSGRHFRRHANVRDQRWTVFGARGKLLIERSIRSVLRLSRCSRDLEMTSSPPPSDLHKGEV